MGLYRRQGVLMREKEKRDVEEGRGADGLDGMVEGNGDEERSMSEIEAERQGEREYAGNERKDGVVVTGWSRFRGIIRV